MCTICSFYEVLSLYAARRFFVFQAESLTVDAESANKCMSQWAKTVQAKEVSVVTIGASLEPLLCMPIHTWNR